MEFISAEEFLKQDEKVQKIFLDWWKPNIGDLLFYLETEGIFMNESVTKITICKWDDEEYLEIKSLSKHDVIPLLTEGQLRQFIEDRLELIHYENDGRKIELDITHNNNFTRIEEGLSTGVRERVTWIIEDELGKKYNLLQVYWQVSIEIAKEEV